MAEMSRKTSTMRRGMKFATVVLQGNLFDTLAFNNVLNILEKHGLNFRIIEWEVGTTEAKESGVALQVVAENEESMDKAKDEVEAECEKHKISIHEGTGPDYEKSIGKMIHKDRVR